jgi:anthranilate phosphoribosyltransferase
MDKREQIEKEIEELEKKFDKNHFGGLFEQAQHKKDMNRLQKLRKELEKSKVKK